MASGSKSKKTRPAAPVISRTKSQGPPWLTIAAVVAILALVGGIFAVVLTRKADEAKLEQWAPTAEKPVPAEDIEGVYIAAAMQQANGAYKFTGFGEGIHINAPQRVAYDRYPPIGGAHDTVWAACNGVVYETPVRDEAMVHPLEHGAVWVAYNPDTIADGDKEVLEGLVKNKAFMVMTPYPSLDRPISLQAWGQQLKVDSATDERVRQFITATLRNPYTYPEIGATCDQPSFNIQNPPAFDGSPRTDADVPMDGGTRAPDTGDHTQPLDLETTVLDGESVVVESSGQETADGADETGADEATTESGTESN